MESCSKAWGICIITAGNIEKKLIKIPNYFWGKSFEKWPSRFSSSVKFWSELVKLGWSYFEFQFSFCIKLFFILFYYAGVNFAMCCKKNIFDNNFFYSLDWGVDLFGRFILEICFLNQKKIGSCYLAKWGCSKIPKWSIIVFRMHLSS